MPSAVHEILVELFRQRPQMAAELLREAVSVPLPPFSEARIQSSTFTDLTPPEYRADLVVRLGGKTPVLGIILEVQLQIAPRKRYSWPHYNSRPRAPRREEMAGARGGGVLSRVCSCATHAAPEPGNATGRDSDASRVARLSPLSRVRSYLHLRRGDFRIDPWCRRGVSSVWRD